MDQAAQTTRPQPTVTGAEASTEQAPSAAPLPGGLIQRQLHRRAIQRRASAQIRGPESADASFHDATREGAAEVPYRRDMERSFGQDLSNLQAFTGRAAASRGSRPRRPPGARRWPSVPARRAAS